jgi:hypothetical protein
LQIQKQIYIHIKAFCLENLKLKSSSHSSKLKPSRKSFTPAAMQIVGSR